MKEMLVTLPLKVRTYDIDFAGIVSNIVYIRWLEDLRLEMLDRYFPIQEQLKKDIAPLLLSTEIKYLNALNLYSKPLGRIWLSKLERLRFHLEAEVVDQSSEEDKLSVMARQTGIFIDLKTKRPIPFPEELKKHLT